MGKKVYAEAVVQDIRHQTYRQHNAKECRRFDPLLNPHWLQIEIPPKLRGNFRFGSDEDRDSTCILLVPPYLRPDNPF